ncbi:MAG: histidine kinase [Bacteroidales bacterium]|nr:histidine kinase [Bacteroidales bacterium]
MKEPKEFRFEHNHMAQFNGREILVRIVGIVVISILFPVISYNQLVSGSGIAGVILVSLARTTILWHGSMWIINFLVMRYSVFKQPLKLIGFQVVSLVTFVILVELGEIFVIERILNLPMSRIEKSNILTISVLVTFTISSIYASVSFFIQWKSNLQRAQALEKANMEARYETLRNQVNPHFLFNSLNTLLMLVGDNPVASRYVESVSEFMRYMLNSREKEAVLLRDELKMAREYVFIQQNRFGGKLTVDFEVGEAFYHFAIPPLALQMLIENALKHNVISREHPLQVKVYILDSDFLVVENNIQPKLEKEPSTGVGLENIRNRYLYLSGKEVIVKQEEGLFTVMLPLFEKQFSQGSSSDFPTTGHDPDSDRDRRIC